VLVVGIVPSLTWSVTRSLSRAHWKPFVLGWHRVSPLQLLPDCHYVHWRNVNWIGDEISPEMVDQIDEVCRKHAIDVVLPVDFPTIMLLARHGAKVRSARVAVVPSPDTMRSLHDKWQFSQLLQRLGLPQPRTELALDARALAATSLPFPIITKPVDRWSSVGFQIHRDRAQLEHRIANRTLAAEFPLLVQDFIPGKDVGFAFISHGGKLLAHTAFEQPRRGVRRHFDSPELASYVSALVRETGYQGVGEVDARYDIERAEYRLLEVNPRFWASLLYTARAGMSFPELLVRLDGLEASGEGPGFAAHTRPVKLAPYELAVARSVLTAERAHDRVMRWANTGFFSAARPR
jgi:predicted ATP-grasp superfamily ATP-dependent carboligase